MLVTNFTSLIEARQRAISRSAMTRPLVPLKPVGGAATPTPAPAQQ